MLLCASTSHANDLRTRGYTVLPSPIISASHADRLATTCGARLSSLLAEAREIGYDVSAALLWRPLFTQNVILRLAGAALVPGAGLDDLYDERYDIFYSVFCNATLTY